MTLADFVNVHKGETAHVFGKGPSLDAGREEGLDGPRFCVNESVLCVPPPLHPTYWMSVDEKPIRKVASWRPWMGTITGVLTERRARFAYDLGIRDIVPFAEYIDLYKNQPQKEHLDPETMTREQVAEANALALSDGTVVPLLHFAWLTGVAKVVLVGFGGEGYARCIQQLGVANCTRDYGFILDEAKRMCAMVGLEMEVWDASR